MVIYLCISFPLLVLKSLAVLLILENVLNLLLIIDAFTTNSSNDYFETLSAAPRTENLHEVVSESGGLGSLSSLVGSPNLAFKKLSSKAKLKKSPKSVQKALSITRGMATVRGKTPLSSSGIATPSVSVSRSLGLASIKEEPRPIVDSFKSQLALSQSTPELLISELADAINYSFVFVGKVLAKYGTYKIQKANYNRFLKVDLVDKAAHHTITFVVVENYIEQFVNTFVVGDFLRIEGPVVRKKNPSDGGTFQLSLYADATTSLMKAPLFDFVLTLFLEHKIKDLVSSWTSSIEDGVPTVAFTVKGGEHGEK
ncbi:hypothetical protein GOP47_0025001 [Adiantum capillus-veneris]|uniref:Uncharacterized protein n=1 Tax=Adiantum capillus-veneris TaxID=13818 RepID=A0A9D4Z5K2_ADICA|nr:hypothetical protein GOP47_0025001 [Adiantum capillus-veneris]